MPAKLLGATCMLAGLLTVAPGGPAMAQSQPVTFTKSFATNPIEAGASQTMTFTITSTSADQIFEIEFTDDLANFLGGITPTGIDLPANGFCGFGSHASASDSNGILEVQGAFLEANGSCEFSVGFIVPTGLTPGDYTNTTSELNAATGVESFPVNAPAATATLTVNEAPAPGFTKAFTPDRIVQGGISRLTFTIDNGANGIEAAGLAFTDAFPAGLVVADTPEVDNDCGGGTLTAAAGGDTLAFAGGAVAANAACEIRVTVRATGSAGPLTNTTSALESSLPDAPAATATLTVNEAPAPGFTKAFTPDRIVQGGISRLTFTIDNGANGIEAAGLAFTDAFPAGLVVADTPEVDNDCGGGTLTAAAGGDTLAFAGGAVAANAACEIRVTVRATGSAGPLTNTTSALESSLPDAPAATATLTVNEAPAPGFTKAFTPDRIVQGGISRLTFTIDNGANGIEAAGLAFTDAFPAGLVVADTPEVDNDCGGGTLTAAAGGDTLAFAGGAVAANAACEIRVTVRATGSAGPLTNTTSALESSLPDAPAATATLTVNEAPAPGFTKAFTPDRIVQGGISRLTFTIDNGANGIEAAGLAFTDAFPAGLVVADTPEVDNDCGGGTLTAAAGGDTLAFAGGAVAANAACEIRVTVRATGSAGPLTNTTSALESSLPDAPAATATLTVNEAPAPGFTKAFTPDRIVQGGISRLTFTIDNGANGIEAAGLAFTDAFPAGLVVADTPEVDNDCGGGTLTAAAGGDTLAFAGGAVAANAACEIRVTVRATGSAGPLTNTTSALESSLPDAPAATATLTVNEAPAPGFTKAFTPDRIVQGGISRLTFTIDNGANGIEAAGLAFTDAFPAGLVVADTPEVDNDCGGGTLTAAAGGDTLAFAGGAVAANAACEIRVTVRATGSAGPLTNTTSALESSLPDAPAATATLTVNEAPAPGFTKAFTPDRIVQGGISRLTFTIDNGANGIEAAGLAFTDAFPAGLVVADTPEVDNDCGGGTLTAAAGGDTLAFAGGAVAANAACEIRVTVRATGSAGPLTNTTSALESSLPDAPAATATLTVNEAPAPGFTKAFTPDRIVQGGISRLTFTIDNGANGIEAAGLAFTDAFPAGLVVADTPEVDNDCGGGTLTAAAGGDTLAFAGGAVAANAACEIRVTVRATGSAGPLTNTTSALESSLPDAPAATATLTVNEAPAPGFTKAFTPDRIVQGGISRLTFTIDNGANGIEAAGLAFTDAFPAGLVVADTPEVDNDCGGGTLTAAAGGDTLAFAGGAVAANAACEIRVTVRATGSAGPLTNTTSALESSLPDAPAATATLTVNEAPAPGFTKAFTPDRIVQGGISRLTFTIDNGANGIEAAGLAFTDAFPAGLVVADTPEVDNDCGGGTLTAAAGGDTLAFAGGAVAANAACEIRVTVRATGSAGPLTNTTSALESSLPDAPAATATLTVNEAPAPGFTKAFTPDRIVQGGISRLTFTIDNGANGIEAAGLAFTDAFPAGLVVADTPEVDNDCGGGTLTAAAGGDTLAFAGGAVAANAACEIRVTVRATGSAGPLTNTTSALESSLPDAPAATATLTVNEAPAPGFTKAFTPDRIVQGGISRLTFTIDNGANGIEAAGLAFTDAFPAGLVVADTPEVDNDCGGGTLTAAAGGDTLAFAGGAVAANAACEIRVTVRATGSAGPLTNTTSALESSLPDAPAATATLTVNEAPAPGFTKAFTPDRIVQGGISRLTFTIDNGANGIEAAGLAFTDAFPAGLVVADTPEVDNDCGGGTLTAAAGGDTLAFTGGAVAANAACEIRVTVRATGSAGPLTNTTSALESSLPDAPAATATLTVNEAPAPGFTKAFTPDRIVQGGISRLTFTIDNGANGIEAAGLAFTDAFPAGLVVADTPEVDNDCGGGTLTAAAGGDTLAFTGGAVAANAACEIRVTVRATGSAGPLTNTTSALESSLPDAPAATATLTVNEAPAPGFTKAFTPDRIVQGGISRLTFTIDNGANGIEAAGLAFTDAFPAGLVVADTPEVDNDCGGGTLTAAAGGDTLAFAGGAVAANAACEIRVTVRATGSAGPLTNTTSALESSLPDAPAATATLTVNEAPAPGFTKAFTPDRIVQGGISRLTFTIDNGANGIEAAGLAFTDAFPAGLVVADTPEVDNDCGGGTLTAAAGGDTLAFAGGAVAANAACEIRVTVRATGSAGPLTNTTSALESSLPDAPAATATLTVNEAPAPGFTKAFTPDRIVQGGISRLTFTIDNGANGIEAAGLAFTDAFPAGLVVADTPEVDNDCGGGTLTAAAGGDTLAFAGGAVAANAACEIRVTVRATGSAGPLTNTTSALESSLPDAPAATATLTVNEAPAPGFTKAFTPDRIVQGGISRLTFTIDNGANGIEAAGLAFTDAFPAGLVVADTPEVDNDCGGGTLTAAAGGDTLAFAGGAVAANAACEIRVTVRATGSAGPLTNTTSALESSLPDAPAATATLTVNEAPAPGFTKAFTPDRIVQGGISRLTFTIDNGANGIEAAGLAFTDAFPAGLVVADTPEVDNDCGGGTLTAAAGGDTLAFAGGAVAANAACEIRVTVRATGSAGPLTNTTSALESSLPDAPAATATLTVNEAPAPGFTKAFTPDRIVQGGISRLTFTIDNGANGIEAAGLAFTDAFPAGLVVADTPEVDNDCGGGTLTAAAGGDTLAFAGGAVAANAACEIRVTVRATGSAGPLTNTTSALESSLPDAPAATATLTVNEAPLIVSMGFSPSTIAQGGVSTLIYRLRNDAAVGATSISLSDTLPADVTVADAPNAATTCGGTVTAAAGGDTLAFTGGAVAAGDACAISVDVTSAVAGSYLNGPESVTSSLGDSTAAPATLTVDAAVVPAFAGTVTFDVTSDTDGAFGFSSAEPGLTTSLEISGGTGSTGALPVATAGSHSVTVTAPAGVRLTAIACDDTDSTADMSAATVSVTVDASEDVTCTITARSPVEETVETINRFLTRRADLILSSEPDPSRRFDRLKRGSGNTGPISFSNDDLKALLPFTAQGGNGDYGFSTSLPQARRAIASAALALGPDGEVAYIENHRFDAWFEAQYKEFDAGADRRGDFGIAYAGVDYLLTPDVLVGALVSFDTMEETTDTGTVSGDGWMAGPYMTARLAPSLYFDGRLAAGESDNRISPFGVYTDEFPTGRWLSMASLTGEFQRGDWTIRPHASLSYLEERQKSYVDGVGATIPGRTVRLGQFKIGPAFTGRFEGAEGRIYSPYLKVDAIYNVGDTTGATPAEANDAEVEGWRARVKAGVSMTTEHGTRLSLGATHDGIGRSDFETWGLTFELSVPIGKPKAR